jgi:hypothetical protein
MTRAPQSASDRAAEAPRSVVIVAGVVGSLIVAAICVAILFGVGVALVWTTAGIETWLHLPAMSMLIAVVGLGLIATVFVGTGRVVGAIRERRGPLDMLGDLMDRAAVGDEDDEDEDDEDEEQDDEGEQLEFVKLRRQHESRR